MNKIIMMVLKWILVLTWILQVSPLYAEGWGSVEKILGRSGIEVGDQFTIAFPRIDLNVTVQGVPLEPSLALNNWVVFKRIEVGPDKPLKGTLMTGEMVLIERELPKALNLLTRNGFHPVLLSNRLLKESPSVRYVHIKAQGSRANLAQALKFVLFQLSNDSENPTERLTKITITPTVTPKWSEIVSILGPGQSDGKILSYDFPVTTALTDKGFETSFFVGRSTSLRFQKVGGLAIGKKGFWGFGTGSQPSKEDIVASAGDFVITDEQVDLVEKTLIRHRITVTGLDKPLPEDPARLTYLHYWALGTTEEVASGLKEALGQIHLVGTK